MCCAVVIATAGASSEHPVVSYHKVMLVVKGSMQLLPYLLSPLALQISPVIPSVLKKQFLKVLYNPLEFRFAEEYNFFFAHYILPPIVYLVGHYWLFSC